MPSLPRPGPPTRHRGSRAPSRPQGCGARRADQQGTADRPSGAGQLGSRPAGQTRARRCRCGRLPRRRQHGLCGGGPRVIDAPAGVDNEPVTARCGGEKGLATRFGGWPAAILRHHVRRGRRPPHVDLSHRQPPDHVVRALVASGVVDVLDVADKNHRVAGRGLRRGTCGTRGRGSLCRRHDDRAEEQTQHEKGTHQRRSHDPQRRPTSAVRRRWLPAMAGPLWARGRLCRMHPATDGSRRTFAHTGSCRSSGRLAKCRRHSSSTGGTVMPR